MRRLTLLFTAVGMLALTIPAVALQGETPAEQLAAASALFDAGKYAEAAQKLDAFLTTNPKHPKAGAAALTLGLSRTQLQQYPQAVAAYEKALATNSPDVLVEAQFRLGEAAIYAKQYEKAARSLGNAVQNNLKPDRAAIAYLWLGQANYEIKKYAEAEAAYNKVISDYTTSQDIDAAVFGSGLAALRQGKNDLARQRLKMVVDRYRRSEDRPQAMLLVAQIDLEAKRLPQARQEFEAVLQEPAAQKDASLKADAEDGLIQSLLQAGDFATAIPRLESAISRLPASDPQRFRAYVSLGDARYRQRQYDQALAAYAEAAKSPEEAVASAGLYWGANAQLALNHPSEAAALFNKLTTRYPKSDLAAKAQQKAKESSAAAIDSITDPVQLAAALKNLAPAERGGPTIRLARLYLKDKKYVEAAGSLSDFIRTMPQGEIGAEANYLLGLAYDGQDKIVPASVALAEAVKRSPNAVWAADAQSRLTWMYLEQKQPANAEKAANAVLTLKPGAELEQQAKLALVQALLDQQKWEAALDSAKALEQSNSTPETRATALYAQAFATEKRGNADDALTLWDKLSTEFPKSSYAPEAMIRIADARLKEEKYEEARDKYAALLKDFPKSAFAAEARFKLGSSLYNLKMPADAAVEFDAVAADKAAGDYVPEALYWAGVALDKAGKKTDAIQRLSKLVAQYPTHGRVANAKVRLAALKAVSG
jgi:cellulose synthase operon protein C